MDVNPVVQWSFCVCCLGRREFGHGLGSLGNGVLGEFTREHEPDSSLDLTGRESCLLVVGGELTSLGGNALKDIVDEGVHDGHTLLADTGIGVHLLEHLVDVRRIRFDALLVPLASASLLRGLGGFL